MIVYYETMHMADTSPWLHVTDTHGYNITLIARDSYINIYYIIVIVYMTI